MVKIVLATGIYPPDIGGPATYVKHLAEELSKENEVVVVTYGNREIGNPAFAKASADRRESDVVRVSRLVPFLRWFRYAKALKKHGKDADVVYAFSSVSCGIPLILSGLKKPKRVLRLGGDFLWERYTALGGRRSLKSFYESFWFLVFGFWFRRLLRHFDHVVFSTRFQEEIYERHYENLPEHSVIENALQATNHKPQALSGNEKPRSNLKLLFMGRFVGFKNLPALICAIAAINESQLRNMMVTLTLVGDGPMKRKLQKMVEKLGLSSRVLFVAPSEGKEKQDIFASHDLLVIPSITEISPNVALEAVASGLPVLLTEETGLSDDLAKGMVLKPMRTPEQIAKAIDEVSNNLPDVLGDQSSRSWHTVTEEHMMLFNTL